MIALLGGKFCFSECLLTVYFIMCLLFARLVFADFCMDAEAEAADVEQSVHPNVPLGEDANRDMLRAHIRLGKVGPFIGRLREVVGRIDKELWPEDESRQEMEGLMTRLEEVPN